MPQITVTYPNINIVTVNTPRNITLTIPKKTVLTGYDVGQAPYKGITFQVTKTGVSNETSWTITNIGTAKDVFVYHEGLGLAEYTGTGSIPRLYYRRTTNSLEIGTPLAPGEILLIKSSSAIS